jgi:hypothetical protein
MSSRFFGCIEGEIPSKWGPARKIKAPNRGEWVFAAQFDRAVVARFPKGARAWRTEITIETDRGLIIHAE